MIDQRCELCLEAHQVNQNLELGNGNNNGNDNGNGNGNDNGNGNGNGNGNDNGNAGVWCGIGGHKDINAGKSASRSRTKTCGNKKSVPDQVQSYALGSNSIPGSNTCSGREMVMSRIMHDCPETER
ncbi:hypothetical protein Tco_0018156 [Tanacetum coccineum]